MELEIVKVYKNSQVTLSYKVKSKIDKMKINDFEYLLKFLDYKDIFKVIFINRKFKKSIFKLNIVELFKHLVEHGKDFQQLLTFDAALFHCYMSNLNLKESNRYYDSFGLHLYQHFNKNSETLILNDIQIGNRGLYILSNITFFKYLDLGSNNFTDKNAFELSKVIYKNRNLETLVLANNKLTDEGLEIIIRSLVNCKNLKKIDLKSNHLSFNSHIVIENLEKLLIETSITNLNLSYNKIDSTSFNKISAFLFNSNIKDLNISNNNIRLINDEIQNSNCILINSSLESINVGSNKLSNFEVILEFIGNLSSRNQYLKDIDLSNCLLSSFSFQSILEFAKQGSLKKLNLSKNNLKNQETFISDLIIHTSITTLLINSCKLENTNICNIFNRLNDHMQMNKNSDFSIIELDLGCNNFLDESLKSLSKFLQKSKIKEISFASCDLEDSQFAILSKEIFLSDLVSINLSYNNLTNIDEFVNCYEKYLSYNFKALDHIKYNLKSSSNILYDKIFRLKEINLSYNELNDTNLSNLFNLIAFNSLCNLSSINLKSNLLTDHSSTIICSAIIYNDKLEKLNIESNDFTTNSLKDIINAAKIGKLKELKLNQNKERKKITINQSLIDQKIEACSRKNMDINL